MRSFNQGPQEPTIEFICKPSKKGVYPEPVKALEALPDWFRRMSPDAHVPQGYELGTVKDCPPFVDVMMAGYIIPVPVALTVKATETDVVFSWRGTETMVSSHDPKQMPDTPHGSNPFYKFHNPWVIKTPPGYSCLFTAPFNQGQRPYTLFSAIVETDVYQSQVNFPFAWNVYPFEGFIEDGIPLMQVIPFKRERWSGIVRAMSEPEVLETEQEGERVLTKKNYYRRFRRQKKSWGLENPTQ